MPKQTEKETVDRVMHEFKHGELKSGQSGKGGKVKSRKQAIAIALSEAGESDQASPAQNKRARSKTQAKERAGKTAMHQTEGRGAKTRTELYAQAKKREVPGCSKMNRAQLERALRTH